MIFVVDASVAVKWFVPESHTSEAEKLLSGEYQLHAPELILPEFSNIIWRKHKQGHFISTYARTIIKDFQNTDIEIHPHLQTAFAAFVGAEITGQTAYGWTYLTLAVSLSCKFVTADAKFYKALEKTTVKKNLLWIGDLT
jgi:predicted nucleic acid-binding protein